MRFLSLCSGIEAASVAWKPLGWEAVAFSEIEPFPCAVLKHYYPNVPNMGDMTKYEGWKIGGRVDVVVGGTPCQSFSVAGLRKGLADPRGNLSLTFLAIVERFKPRFVVWENVPGVISDKTNALESFLDGLEALGYIIDIDILDAQFHGVAQRRRRVFVCAQSRDDLLKQKTDTSALTIAQAVVEILHGILVESCSQYGRGQESSVLAYPSRDGVTRRMRLFGLLGETSNWPILRSHLVEAFPKYRAGQKNSDASHGEREKERTAEGPLMDSTVEAQSTRTGGSPEKCLDDAHAVMRSFIMLTGTRTITNREIFSCSQAVLATSSLIVRLNHSSPSFWSAASSSLIALREYIDYARSTGNDLFGRMDGIQAWRDFVRQAVSVCDTIGNTRTGTSLGKVPSISESLRGDSAPSRKTREGVAGTVKGGSGSRGYPDPSDGNGGGLTVAKAVRTPTGGIDREDSHTLIASTIQKHHGNPQLDQTMIPSAAQPIRGNVYNNSDPGMEVRGLIPTIARSVAAGRDGYNDGSDQTYIPQTVGTLSDGAHMGGGANGQDAYTGRIIPAFRGVDVAGAGQQGRGQRHEAGAPDPDWGRL